MELLLTVIALVVCGYFWLSWRRKRLDIPGPPGNIISGNARQLDKENPHETIRQWASEYGDVMKINIYGKDAVIANSMEAIKEILVTKSDEYAGRPKSFLFDYILPDTDVNLYDISPKWIIMKRVCMIGLKQVGDHLKELEDLSMEIIEDLATKMMSYEGQEVDLREDFYIAVSDITFSLVYGRKLPTLDHKEFQDINKEYVQALNPTADNKDLDTFPFLRYSWYYKFRNLERVRNRLQGFHRRHLDITLSNYKDDEVRCMADGLIKERKKQLMEGKTEDVITMGNLAAVALNLVITGVITTSGVSYFLPSLLATYPEIQSEAYAQITKVIGQRPPTLKDRFSIPYIESMILELLRYMSHVPLGSPHRTMKDTTLLGYQIPKATEIWTNLWFLHHNEKLWEDPWKFKPTRFLDNEGNLLLPDHPLRKQIFIFGAGRRVCAGEVMARNRLFLMAVVLIQRFQFLPPEGQPINVDPRSFELGFTLIPKDYKVKVIPRQ